MDNVDLFLAWGFDVRLEQQGGGCMMTLTSNRLNTSHHYTEIRPNFNGRDNVFCAATTEAAAEKAMTWVQGWLQ